VNARSSGKFRKYHFEWKHVLVLFTVLILFQVIISIIHNISLKDLLNQTQDWYKQDSAEKLANLTTTSLELLLQIGASDKLSTAKEKDDIIQSFNIILNQQLLQQNVKDICILLPHEDQLYAIDNGRILYEFMYEGRHDPDLPEMDHSGAKLLYQKIGSEVHRSEQIHTVSEENQIFHVFVPVVPFGEYAGALYMRIEPDFSFLADQIISKYNETTIIFSSLILFGLLAVQGGTAYDFDGSDYALIEGNRAPQITVVGGQAILGDSGGIGDPPAAPPPPPDPPDITGADPAQVIALARSANSPVCRGN
jgi:hypothetical protein